MTLSELKEVFGQQRGNAAKRGIGFHLTFEEWLEIWESSGHLADRGRGRGKYVMSRVGDRGPYAVGNVFIQLFTDNVSQGRKNRTERSRPCTLDGVTIYPAVIALVKVHGHGRGGRHNPNFRFVQVQAQT